MKRKQDHKHIYDTCQNHMHAYVLVETVDGQKYDGIITGLDDDNVYLAVPISMDNEEGQRQFQYGYHSGHYGYPSGQYGYPSGQYGQWFPPRRFRRLTLPLVALAALSLLPWY